MIALADNVAVSNPVAALSRIQRDCLLAIDFYRHQKRTTGYWQIGEKRFAMPTIDKLKDAGLIRFTGRGYGPTQAGKLAIDKLKGEKQ